jgi:hypothetical protein
MLRNILLDKNVLPFSISCTFDKFQAEYIKAKKTSNQTSVIFVWEQLKKDLTCWAECFEKKDFHTNITVYTCLRLLKADNKTPGTLFNKISLLETYMAFFDLTYLDIVQEAFLLHINKRSYIPMYKYSKPKDLYYYIAKEIKMFIFSIFRKYITYQKKQNAIQLHSTPSLGHYYDYYFDLEYLNNVPIELYKRLLFQTLTQSLPKHNNLNFTHSSNYAEETHLCQLIKTLQSSN